MLIMHMTAYQCSRKSISDTTDFANRMHLTENEVSMILQRLMQHGFLQIKQSEDENGVLL